VGATPGAGRRETGGGAAGNSGAVPGAEAGKRPTLAQQTQVAPEEQIGRAGQSKEQPNSLQGPQCCVMSSEKRIAIEATPTTMPTTAFNVSLRSSKNSLPSLLAARLCLQSATIPATTGGTIKDREPAMVPPFADEVMISLMVVGATYRIPVTMPAIAAPVRAPLAYRPTSSMRSPADSCWTCPDK